MDGSVAPAEPQHFECCADTVIWAVGRARSGAAASGAARKVLDELDLLYQRRQIELGHASVVRTWAERGVAPDPDVPDERNAALAWRVVMLKLDKPLREAGIVLGRDPGGADLEAMQIIRAAAAMAIASGTLTEQFCGRVLAAVDRVAGIVEQGARSNAI